MSQALANEVAKLRKRVEVLERRLEGLDRDELMAYLAEHYQRKRGRKPGEDRENGETQQAAL